MPHTSRLLTLALALATAPTGPARAQAVPAGPVGSIDSLTAFSERAERRPLAWGLSWNPERDPDGGRPYLFLVGADSTVWVEDPDGRTSTVDAYVAMAVGETAGERTGYAEGRPSHFGYGFEDGRVFLYLRQGAQAYAAAALAAALVAGTATLVGWLARRLRAEGRQRRALADAHRRLVEAREDERLRIAQDLHDGPVQDLNLVNLRLAAVRTTGGPPDDVAELRAEVVGVVREIRAISEALRPPALGPFGLAAALRAHSERFRRLHPDIAVRLDLDDDGQALPEGVRLALFRVAQEAMTNAAKHGRPSEVRVALRLTDGVVRLEVGDDGGGYTVPDDPSALTRGGHYGLVGMRERAEAVGARLGLESAPGHGTTVSVEARRDAPEWAAAPMQQRV